jgi:hypothetical protein
MKLKIRGGVNGVYIIKIENERQRRVNNYRTKGFQTIIDRDLTWIVSGITTLSSGSSGLILSVHWETMFLNSLSSGLTKRIPVMFVPLYLNESKSKVCMSWKRLTSRNDCWLWPKRRRFVVCVPAYSPGMRWWNCVPIPWDPPVALEIAHPKGCWTSNPTEFLSHRSPLSLEVLF